jgi:hypothetical protein
VNSEPAEFLSRETPGGQQPGSEGLITDWTARRSVRPLAVKVAIGLTGVVVLLLFFHEGIYESFPYKFTDFSIYYASARVAASGGSPFVRDAVGGELARLGLTTSLQEYLYPSIFLVLLRPLIALSLAQAHQAFMLSSYLCLAGIVVLLWRSANLLCEGGRISWWIVAIGVLSFTPVWSDLIINQNNLWVLLPLTASLYLTLRHRDSWAGAALGLSVMFKITPAFLFLYFLFKRRWRALAGGLAALASLEVISALYFGRFLDLQLPAALQEHSARKLFEWNNVSVPALLARAMAAPSQSGDLPDAGFLLAVSATVVVAIGLPTLYVVWKRRQSGRTIGALTFGLLTTAFLALSPLVFGHHLVNLLVPYTILGSLLLAKPPGDLSETERRMATDLRADPVLFNWGRPLVLTLFATSFILVELDYWRIWLFANLESWGWWAHPATWGMLLLWAVQLTVVLCPQLVVSDSSPTIAELQPAGSAEYQAG